MIRTPIFLLLLLLSATLLLATSVFAEDTSGAAKRRFTRVVAPDGIQIRRWNKTDGKKPGKSDTVVVHYHGTLKDGTVFDSSVRRRQPASFSLDQVIPCWTEALTRLRVGEKAEVICPPRTAYGLRGSPPKIPRNATLKFDLELLAVR